jgi:hypothetical protein
MSSRQKVPGNHPSLALSPTSATMRTKYDCTTRAATLRAMTMVSFHCLARVSREWCTTMRTCARNQYHTDRKKSVDAQATAATPGCSGRMGGRRCVRTGRLAASPRAWCVPFAVAVVDATHLLASISPGAKRVALHNPRFACRSFTTPMGQITSNDTPAHIIDVADRVTTRCV